MRLTSLSTWTQQQVYGPDVEKALPCEREICISNVQRVRRTSFICVSNGHWHMYHRINGTCSQITYEQMYIHDDLIKYEWRNTDEPLVASTGRLRASIYISTNWPLYIRPHNAYVVRSILWPNGYFVPYTVLWPPTGHVPWVGKIQEIRITGLAAASTGWALSHPVVLLVEALLHDAYAELTHDVSLF